MEIMTELIFLGSGGGRFATIFQERATGGLYIKEKKIWIHIDPGPGALVALHQRKVDPTRTDMILVSHIHPDHSSDLAILAEAMTMGGKVRRGVILGSKSVIRGAGAFDPGISRYHRSMVKLVRYMKEQEKFIYQNLTVQSFPCYHSDKSSIGFKIFTSAGIISYVSDTSYNPEIIRNNKGARILVLPLTRPRKARINHHICSEDAVKLAEKIQPELVILNHLGLKLIRQGPEEEAAFIQEESGIQTIAATDDLRVVLDKEKLEIFRDRDPEQQTP